MLGLKAQLPTNTATLPRASTTSACAGQRNGSLELEFKHPHRVAEVDAPGIDLRQLERVQRLDCLADEQRAALRVERAVGAEQHVLRAEEIEAAAERARRAGHRAVSVQHPEV